MVSAKCYYIYFFLNISRAIHREEALYPDSEIFNPERWLSPDYPTFREPLNKFPNLQNFSAFGFGRRICPGMNIAEKSLFILTARMAWAYSIKKRPGVAVPWYDYTSGFNVQPKPFTLIWRLEFQKRGHLLRGSGRRMRKEIQLRSSYEL
jgi:cytochrome P450